MKTRVLFFSYSYMILIIKQEEQEESSNKIYSNREAVIE